MSARQFVVLVLVAVAVCSGATALGSAEVGASGVESDRADNTTATLVAAYPNPVARGDPGEFVTVRFSEPTNTTGWTLTDGKTTARLPNRTVEGTVAFSVTPTDAREHTDHPVSTLKGRLLLADGGETLELRDSNETIDTATYHNAPESRIRDFEANEWRPVGTTDFEPLEAAGATARAFVLPDSPEKTAARFQEADERLLVAGYTLTSSEITDSLVAAHDGGVDVRVLLDGRPVGGISERQARQLDRLTEAGIPVRLLAGPHTRYQHHHPKYAIVDDRAVVLTENFKPAGTGGMASRGWGVTVSDPAVADELAALYTNDWEWRAATPWERYREGRDFTDADPALGSFETHHPPETVALESTTVLVAPDNAADALVDELESAEKRILVQQVRIDSRDNRLLRATLRAAERGVPVRIHLADAWYVEDENAELVAWLNRRAESEGWDLEARVDTADGYDRIHTKGVVIDETAVVGSLNWGRTAKQDNREVVLALEGEEVAAYYANIFESDFSERDERSLPTGLFGGAAVAIAAALLVARKIEFLGREGVITDWQS